jgi:DNA-binding SARP family transcriptional activator/Flp pilus assembly protein TadD
MPADSFRLLTLGRLALLTPTGDEDRSLGTRRRKLAVLAYLALARRPIPRDTLVELFWGDQDEDRARHSLSDALSHLRRALGADAISTGRAEIVFNQSAPLALDVIELQAAFTAKRWDAVVSLYAGPFLDAVHLQDSPRWEQWVTQQRTAAERSFETAARAECARLAAAGEWGPCAALAGRWLEQLPLAQDAAAHLLDATTRAADSPAEGARHALDAFLLWRRRLESEYDLSPEPALLTRAEALEAIATPMLPSEPAPPPVKADPLPTDHHVRPETEPIPAMIAPPRRSRWRAALAIAAVLLLSLGALALPRSRTERARALHEQARDGEGRLHAESEARVREALAADSTFAPAWRTLGSILRADESAIAEATSAYAKAYEHRETVDGIERLRIIASYQLEVLSDYAAAAATLREVLRLNASQGSVWHELGAIYQRLGDPIRAADAYTRANQFNSKSVGRWMNLVDMLVSAGDTAGARAAVDSLAVAIPGTPTVFRLTANLASARGDFLEAERQIRAYIRAQSSNTRGQRIGHDLLARALWSANRLDDGDRAARESSALSLARGEPEIALMSQLAMVQVEVWRRDDRRQARQELEDALRSTPIDSIAPLRRPLPQIAAAFALLGDTLRAIELLERYDSEFPDEAKRYGEAAVAYAYGLIALASGDPTRAVEELQRVPSPECEVCGLPELGRAYEALGDPVSARTQYRAFLETPTLRRTDLVDALHRDWVTSRLARPR